MKQVKNDKFEKWLLDKNNRLAYIFLAFLTLSAVLFFADIIIHGKESASFYFFWDGCDDLFADFVNVVGYSAYGDPYNCTAYYGMGSYPPLTYVLLRPFAGLVDIEKYYEEDFFLGMLTEQKFLISFFIIMLFVLLIIFYVFHNASGGSKKIKIWTAIAFVFCAPLLYTVERGNILLLSLLFTAYYLFHYDDENKVRRELALISLGLAFSLKITPAVCGVLLLYNKKFREAIHCAIYGVLSFMIPFLFLKGGFSNIMQMRENIRDMTGGYAYLSLDSFFPISSYFLPNNLLRGVQLLISLFLLLLFPFYRKRWEKILAVTLVLMIAPPVSQYYCLIYIIPAVILFLAEKERSKRDLVFAILMLLVLVFPNFKLIYIIPSQVWVMIMAFIMILLAVADFIRSKAKQKS